MSWQAYLRFVVFLALSLAVYCTYSVRRADGERYLPVEAAHSRCCLPDFKILFATTAGFTSSCRRPWRPRLAWGAALGNHSETGGGDVL